MPGFVLPEFELLVLGYVAVDLKDRRRLAVVVPLQYPTARYHGLRAVAFGVYEFAFPVSLAKELGLYLFQRLREPLFQQRKAAFPHSLFPAPTIRILRTAIPEGDRAVHIADQDGIMGEVEQSRLLAQGLHPLRQFLLVPFALY